MVAYRSFSFPRWYTHMIHYGFFENPNFRKIVYPHNSLGILAWSRFCLCAVSNGQKLVPIMVVYRCFSFSRWYAHIIHYGFLNNTNVYRIVYPQNRLDIITWSRFCLCVVSSGSDLVPVIHTFDDIFWNNCRWDDHVFGLHHVSISAKLSRYVSFI
jgi:hypothetical protein